MHNKGPSIEELFSNLSGGTILDVATGAGNFAMLMEKQFQNPGIIAAIDTTTGLLIHIKEKVESKKIQPLVMDGGLLGFKNNTFDTVAISNSLHHLKDPGIILREMSRTLVPDGHFIIREMFCDGDQTPAQKTHTLLHNWWAAIDTLNNVTHNQVFTEEALKNLAKSIDLTDTNFSIVEDTSTDPFEPDMIEYLNKALDVYTKRVENNAKLSQQGRTAREHLNKFGFCNARSLLTICKKKSFA